MAKKIRWVWLDVTISSYEYRATKKIRAATRRLKPGMMVRHGNTHTIGVIRMEDPEKPSRVEPWPFIPVCTRIKPGLKRAGSWSYRRWNIAHLQIRA